MTRKEFVVQVVNDLKENPKAVLRGHGLNPTFLEMLSSREDILGKIVSFAFSTKTATKGKKALLKQNNMRIFAYKNFADFNTKGRNDVQTFMEGLTPEDVETFNNKNNIIVILALPDNGDTGNTEENISLGKSVMLSFDSAVKKEYKLTGGVYYVIMYGDSAIRAAEAQKAEAKEVVNEKTVKLINTPNKIKSNLIKKAKTKMAKINNKDKRLRSKANLVSSELNELSAYAKQLGLSSDVKPGDITSADREFNRRTTAGSRALKEARIDEHKRTINTIRMRNRILVQELQNAETAKKRADIRFAINKNKEKIDALKARIAVYDDFNARTFKNKAKILSEVQAEIDANLAAGQNITNSLNAALAKLNLNSEEKQQIAQQVIEEVVNNEMPLQYAAQQVLQETLPQEVPVVEEVPVAKVRKPRKRKTIEEILNTPVEPFISNDLVNDSFTDELTANSSPNFNKSQAIQDVLSII